MKQKTGVGGTRGRGRGRYDVELIERIRDPRYMQKLSSSKGEYRSEVYDTTRCKQNTSDDEFLMKNGTVIDRMSMDL